MAKQRSKSKNLSIARDLNEKRKRFGFLSIALLLVALVIFFGFNILVSAEIINLENMVADGAIYIVFIVLAGAVGTCTYQWTKAKRELEAYLQKAGLSKDDL